MVAELHVNDLGASLAFWRDILTFSVAYQRDDSFFYLEHAGGHQIMLCQRNDRFETGPLIHPLGQGAMFQFYFDKVGPVIDRLRSQNWNLSRPSRDLARQVGNAEHGQLEVFVQNPDGYLLMFAQHIGQRAL